MRQLSLDLLGLAGTTIDDDGYVHAQLDSDHNAPHVETHQPFGFRARPPDATIGPDGAVTASATVLVVEEGDRSHALLGEDVAVIKKLPQLKPGESYQYGAAGQFIICKADGTIALVTSTDAGAPTGKTIALVLSPTDGVQLITPWGTSTLAGPTGVHLKDGSGARLDLAGISGLPEPLAHLASYATLSADVVQVPAPALSLGASKGTQQAAAGALIAAWMAATNAAIVAVGGTPVPPVPLPVILAAIFPS